MKMFRFLRSRKFWLIFCGCVLTLVAAYYVFYAVVSYRLNAELARLVEEGEIIEHAEFAPPSVADEDNAAFLLTEASKVINLRLKHFYTLRRILIKYPAQLTDGEKLFLEYALAQYGECDRLVEKALEKPAYFAANDYSNPFQYTTSHLLALKKCSNIPFLKAYSHAFKGNRSDAYKALEQIFKLSQYLKNEPYLISQLIRNALMNNGCRYLRGVCDILNATEQESLDLLSLLQEEPNSALKTALEALRAEMILLYEYFHRVRDLSGDESRIRRPWVIFLPLLLDELEFLEQMNRYISFSCLKFYEIPFNDPCFEPAKYWYTTLFVGLRENMESVFRKRAMSRASIRLARIDLAIRIYKHRNGSLPKRLVELIGIIPEKDLVDPFTGKLLLYRLEGKAYALYSTGRDCTDDGGVYEPSRSGPQKDFIWTSFRTKRKTVERGKKKGRLADKIIWPEEKAKQ